MCVDSGLGCGMVQEDTKLDYLGLRSFLEELLMQWTGVGKATEWWGSEECSGLRTRRRVQGRSLRRTRRVQDRSLRRTRRRVQGRVSQENQEESTRQVSQENQSPGGRRTFLYLWGEGRFRVESQQPSSDLWPKAGGQCGCGEQQVAELWSRLSSPRVSCTSQLRGPLSICEQVHSNVIYIYIICTYTYTHNMIYYIYIHLYRSTVSIWILTVT